MAVDGDFDPGQARAVSQERQPQPVDTARLLGKIKLDGERVPPVSRPAIDRARLKGEPVVRGMAAANYKNGVLRGVRVVERGFSGRRVQVTAEFGRRLVQNTNLPERLGVPSQRRCEDQPDQST